MNVQQGLHAFQFKDEPLLNQEIDSITAFKQDASVVYWQRMLKLEGDARLSKLVGQALFVGGFQ